MLRSLRVRRVPTDAGFSLMELVVTMAIMMVVGTILFLIFVQTTSVVGRERSQVQTTNDAQIAMRTMTEDIRSGTSLTFTSSVSGACQSSPTAGNCLTFTVVRDNTSYASCKNVITYGVVADSSTSSLTGWKLMRTITGSSCAAGNGTITRPLLTNVGSGSVFSYYNGSGSILSSGQSAAKSVGITLTVTYKTGATPVTLSGFAALRNAR